MPRPTSYAVFCLKKKKLLSVAGRGVTAACTNALCSLCLTLFLCAHPPLCLLFFILRPPPLSPTLFPYTTLFRSPSVDKQASHFVHIPGLSYSGVKSPTECQQSLFESHFASRQSLSDCPVAF